MSRNVYVGTTVGAFIKRAVTLDEQGSIATVTDATGYSHAEIHDDHGERVTVPQRRTGWLDRELDYETAPGHVRHKLYDLDHRKYDAATAQFLSVDPLWPMFISSGSYVYCTGDAINNVDPWGLGEVPEDIMPPKRPPSKPLVPFSPMVTGHGDETLGGSLWTYEILFGQYLRKLGATGDGMGPQGNGPGVSVLTPPGGIGPGGKGGVGYWSGRGATPETAVQLKGVVVKPWHAPMALATAANEGLQWAGYGETGLAGIQIGLVNHRNSLSISSKIGTFSRFSSTYRTLGYGTKILGSGATYVGAPLSIGLDYVNPEVSTARFAYRTTGTLSSVFGGMAIGAEFGGPYGALGGAGISLIFFGGEMAYDGASWLWNETKIQIYNFENGVKNGWYPGR